MYAYIGVPWPARQVGCVELRTGQRPFCGGTAVKLLVKFSAVGLDLEPCTLCVHVWFSFTAKCETLCPGQPHGLIAPLAFNCLAGCAFPC